MQIANISQMARVVAVAIVVLGTTLLGGCGGADQQAGTKAQVITSGKVVTCRLWEKPAPRQGELGENAFLDAPAGSRVEVYANFIIVTAPDGIHRLSPNGWYSNLAFKTE
ncbi:MAG TPA: hypothetical protein VIL86_20120 [Tepidisphaeraceae bacterium]|jgi:ABC-type cobalt transport system substrate-binding protein